jgi:hypothetical protein
MGIVWLWRPVCGQVHLKFRVYGLSIRVGCPLVGSGYEGGLSVHMLFLMKGDLPGLVTIFNSLGVWGGTPGGSPQRSRRRGSLQVSPSLRIEAESPKWISTGDYSHGVLHGHRPKGTPWGILRVEFVGGGP